MEIIAFIVGGYLIGSVSSAVLVSRVLGLIDPRTAGSGNPGATNVLRLSGKVAGALTLIGDTIKGTIPVLIAIFATNDSLVIAATVLAAFLGHLYPIYFRFKGGKGVATMFGAYLGINPWIAITAGVVWLATAAVSRFSSVSSITSAFAAPLIAWYFSQDVYVIGAAAIISIFVAVRHKENIKRLLAGEESKIRFVRK